MRRMAYSECVAAGLAANMEGTNFFFTSTSASLMYSCLRLKLRKGDS